jgi:hypothetical protein
MRGHFHFIVVLALLLAAPTAAVGETEPSQAPHCTVPSGPGWNEQEQFAWSQLCSDKIADLTARPGDRTLSKAFLETILTNSNYRGALMRHGIRITGARFTQMLDLQNVRLDVELWFDQCRFENDGGVDLSWLQSSQPVGFSRSTVTGPLTFYEAQLASDLIVTESTIGAVKLTGAHIGRTLDFSKSTVTGNLDMAGIDVGADLLMQEGQYQAVDLSGGRVGHTLSLSKSHFAGDGAMSNLQVVTNLQMDGASFAEGIDLPYSQIGGDLDWSGATFNKNIDLTAAHVGGAFVLGSRRKRPGDQTNPAEWASPQVALIARYANIGVIPRLADAWPGTLHLVGLTYNGIAYDDDIAEVRNDFDRWFKRQRYSRQPYEQLANVLQARGEIETATAVRYAERERDRDRAFDEGRFDIYGWLTLLKSVIGYGYYPYRSAWFVLGFILLGMGVLRVSGEGRRNGMPIGASYSFDMLLPIIQLRGSHYAIDLAGWPRYYFYFHKIVGWVLASFLIAGLSGLTK